MTTTITGTHQELFDRVCAHLAQQGRPSVQPSGESCMYRNPDGLRCAIGALLPDDAPFEELDGALCAGITELIDDGAITTTADRLFLNELQYAHDQGVSAAQIRQYLKSTADAYGLNSAAVTQIERWQR